MAYGENRRCFFTATLVGFGCALLFFLMAILTFVTRNVSKEPQTRHAFIVGVTTDAVLIAFSAGISVLHSYFLAWLRNYTSTRLTAQRRHGMLKVLIWDGQILLLRIFPPLACLVILSKVNLAFAFTPLALLVLACVTQVPLFFIRYPSISPVRFYRRRQKWRYSRLSTKLNDSDIFVPIHKDMRDSRKEVAPPIQSRDIDTRLNPVLSSKPLLEKGRSLATPDWEKEERRRFPTFLRCSCCISASNPTLISCPRSDIETTSMGRCSDRYSTWLENREQALSGGFASLILSASSDGEPKLLELNSSLLDFNPHRLCERCSSLCATSHLLHVPSRRSNTDRLREWLSTRPLVENFEHWDTPQQLANSANGGCHFCTLIWKSMSSYQQDILLAGDREVEEEMNQQISKANCHNKVEDIRKSFHLHRCTRILVLDRTTYETLRIETVFKTGERHLCLVPHFGGTKRPQHWKRSLRSFPAVDYFPRYEFTRPIEVCRISVSCKPVILPYGQSTGADNVIEMLRQILEADEPLPQPGDETLSPTAESNSVPTRLIDVTQSASNYIRLRLRSEVLSEGKRNQSYLALSHCWGTDPFITLRTANYEEFRSGVRVDNLAQSFQQAVSTTLRLGYKYIWIDSLCIIQDSPQDWLAEAQQMANVYRHAKHTIAAVAGWSAHEGFYRDQQPLSRHPCYIGDGLHAMPSGEHIGMSRYIDVELSKWNDRGWCFQERQISPSLIFFGETGIYFEKRSVARGEPENDQEALASRETGREMIIQQRAEHSTTHTLWWKYVSWFSNKELTKQSDKLIALSGVANLFRDQPNFRRVPYLHGIWGNEYLLSGLLWYVSTPSRATIIVPRQSPSWSWASLNGEVRNDSVNLISPKTAAIAVVTAISNRESSQGSTVDIYPNTNHTVVDSQTTLYPTVSIDISGKLNTATWEQEADPSKKQYYRGSWARSNRGEQNEKSSDLSSVSNSSNDGPEVLYLMFQGRRIGYFLPDILPTRRADETFNIAKDIHCLQFNIEPADEAGKNDPCVEWVTRGLALEETAKGSRDFRRVGFFELDRSEVQLVQINYTAAWKLGKGQDNRPLRFWPDIDPYRFFKDTKTETIKLI